jgi:hypothetical protein
MKNSLPFGEVGGAYNEIFKQILEVYKPSGCGSKKRFV